MEDKITLAINQHRLGLDLVWENRKTICTIALLFKKTFEKGKKIFFFGNGGSAADAQHLTAEFVGRFLKKRRPLPAIALSVNTSTLTAVGNDFGFDEVFSRQIAALGSPGDVAVAISTSGKSNNIIRGLQEAKKNKLTTVSFLGNDGGEAKKFSDTALVISSSQTPLIQEMHIFAGHIICDLTESYLAT